MPANEGQTLKEKIDAAISYNVNRGLIHEDRWTDLKEAILQAVDEVVEQIIEFKCERQNCDCRYIKEAQRARKEALLKGETK